MMVYTVAWFGKSRNEWDKQEKDRVAVFSRRAEREAFAAGLEFAGVKVKRDDAVLDEHT